MCLAVVCATIPLACVGGRLTPQAAWMALAAGWSGGSVMPPEFGNAPAAPHQTSDPQAPSPAQTDVAEKRGWKRFS